MDWYFDLLHRGDGDLLYEHMECEQLIPEKLSASALIQ